MIDQQITIAAMGISLIAYVIGTIALVMGSNRRIESTYQRAYEEEFAARQQATHTVALLLSNIYPEQHPELLSNVLRTVLDELDRATELHPHWPIDAVHAAAVVAEEAGELLREANNWTNDELLFIKDAMRTEAVHTAVTAIRFLMNIESLQALPSNRGDFER
jgi:hypothetical protein